MIEMQKNSKQKLLEKIDIVDFISNYVDLKKSGSGYVGFSPFKDEKTPSFTVTPQKNIFKDFSTGLGGDVIKFYSLMEKITYKDALFALSKRYNVRLSSLEYKVDKNEKYYLEILKVNKYFQDNLNKSTRAIEYLEKRFYTKEDIKKFSLGYSLENYTDLVDKFDNSLLEELGLLKFNKIYYSPFVDRIIFPIFNTDRKIVGFGARDISGKENTAKYLNSKESKIFTKGNELFGLFDGGSIIKKYNSCILVEGFFDVLRLHKNNIPNTIASLGTALTDNQAMLISKMTKNIVIAYDDDIAGLEAKIRSINILNKYGFNIKIMSLNGLAKDPDEFILKYGKKKFIELYNQSIDAFEFIFNYYSKSYDMSQIASKISVLNSLKKYFSSFKSQIHFEKNLENLSNKLNISKEALSKELNFSGTIRENHTNKIIQKKETKKKKSKIEQLEEITIFMLYNKVNERKKYLLFEFYPTYKDVLENLLKENFDINSLDSENKHILFDIISKYDEKTLNDNYIDEIYSKWVEVYIKDSLNYIYILNGGNYNNMTSDLYKEYVNYINKIKKIKSMDIDDTRKLFTEYRKYEERNLYAFTKK